jgi:hypothetical protein
MPAFGDLLSPTQAQAIRAYVLDRAHDAVAQSQVQPGP